MSITRADVLAVQRGIEKRGAFAVAKKVRTWLKELFAYAVVLGEVPLNPTLYLGELAFPSEDGRGMNPFLPLKELCACACALPEQRYLFCHRLDPQQTISENTLNMALKRLGFNGRLTSLGIRSTLFEALIELGFKAAWVNAQMYHFNQEMIRRTYNHAQYIAQRRRMTQSWADLLDLWEKEARFNRGYL